MYDCHSLMCYFLCDNVVFVLCLCVPVHVLLLSFLDSQLPNCSLFLLFVSLIQLHTHLSSLSCTGGHTLTSQRCELLSGILAHPEQNGCWTLTMHSPGGAIKPHEHDPTSWPVSHALPFHDYLFIYFLSSLPPHPICFSGYAVTAGHFSQPTTTDVVGGAPQDGGIGKVWLFVKQ